MSKEHATVFVITDRESALEGCYIQGIFTTLERAEAAFNKTLKHGLLDIEEWRLDKLSSGKPIRSKSND